MIKLKDWQINNYIAMFEDRDCIDELFNYKQKDYDFMVDLTNNNDMYDFMFSLIIFNKNKEQVYDDELTFDGFKMILQLE